MKKNLSQSINILLNVSNLNQSELAQKIGVSKQAISKYKSGKSGVDENSENGKKLLKLFNDYNVKYQTDKEENFKNSEKDPRENLEIKINTEFKFNETSLSMIRMSKNDYSFDINVSSKYNNGFKEYVFNQDVYDYSPFLGKNKYEFYDKVKNKPVGKKITVISKKNKVINLSIEETANTNLKYGKKIIFSETILENDHIEFSTVIEKEGSPPVVFEYLKLLKDYENKGEDYDSYKLTLLAVINCRLLERKLTFPKGYPIRNVELFIHRNNLRNKMEEDKIIEEGFFKIEKDGNYITSVYCKINNPKSGLKYCISYVPPTISELLASDFINKKQREIFDDKLKIYEYSLKLPDSLREFENYTQMEDIKCLFEKGKLNVKDIDNYRDLYKKLVNSYNETREILKEFINFQEAKPK